MSDTSDARRGEPEPAALSQPPGAEHGGAEPDVPQRVLRDPQELRALAHPVRLKIIEELVEGGPATATELSERVGESPANCSWHLRQLARYGFIDRAEGGTGRQRPWRFVRQAFSYGRHDEPELAQAEDAVTEVLLGHEVEAYADWLASRRHDAKEWRDAAYDFHSRNWLTASELAALRRDLEEVLERHLAAHGERIDPARRPPGCRPIHASGWVVPSGPEKETPEAETTGTGTSGTGTSGTRTPVDRQQ